MRTGIGALLDGAPRPITLELESAGTVTKTLSPYGLGDVTGLAEGTVVRTIPRDGATDFEPNLFELPARARPLFALAAGVAPEAVSPTASIVVRQHVLPLGHAITAYGNIPLSTGQRFAISAPSTYASQRETLRTTPSLRFEIVPLAHAS